MCMVIFLRVIILSSKVTKPTFVTRVWEWRGIGIDCPEFTKICIVSFTSPPPRLQKGLKCGKGTE